MSLNKKALARYMVYDRCFRDEGRKYTIGELMEECNRALKRLYHSSGVSRRQVYYDIEFMKSEDGFCAPIHSEKNDQGKKFYFYKDKSYSVFSFLSGENLIGYAEIIYLLSIIRLLSGNDFVECLINMRGYRHPNLAESLKKISEISGLWNNYHSLKKMYILMDGMICNKRMEVYHNRRTHVLRPESINMENDNPCVIFSDAESGEKRKMLMEDLEILKILSF